MAKLTKEEIKKLRDAGNQGLENVTLEKGAALKNIELVNSIFEEKVIISKNVSVKGSLVKNYKLGEGVKVENSSLKVDGMTSFGNGVEMELLNENGKRPTLSFDRLNNVFAYLLAGYREDNDLIAKLSAMAKDYISSVGSDLGEVGRNAVIYNSTVKDSKIGEAAHIENSCVTASTIQSSSEDKSEVMAGAQINQSILCKGAAVEYNAIVDKSFVGEAVHVKKGCSLFMSALFANSEFEHGEVICTLGLPYTVTHHGGTLVIALLTSFSNFGSTSNSSNHGYKTGPVNQAVFERGTKLGSGSYMLFPAYTGVGCVVLGKHYENINCALPFSYIFEGGGVYPAMNLNTVGTVRDGEKWASRDRRRLTKEDRITFDYFNPRTVEAIVAAIDTLKQISSSQNAEAQKGKFIYNSVHPINPKHLDKGLKLYQDCLERLVINQVREKLKETKKLGTGLAAREVPCSHWLDVGGLVMAKKSCDELRAKIKSGKIKTIDAFNKELDAINAGYADSEYALYSKLLKDRFGKELASLDAAAIKSLLSKGIDLQKAWAQEVLADAKKEWSESSMVSYGLSEDDGAQGKDFAAVRGEYEGNKFVKAMKKDLDEYIAGSNELIEKL